VSDVDDEIRLRADRYLNASLVYRFHLERNVAGMDEREHKEAFREYALAMSELNKARDALHAITEAPPAHYALDALSPVETKPTQEDAA
jgi:hypothetical protein